MEAAVGSRVNVCACVAGEGGSFCSGSTSIEEGLENLVIKICLLVLL